MSEYSPDINMISTTSATGKSMLNLPDRNDHMLNGAEIGKALLNSIGDQRDIAFGEQVLSGNIPSAVRNFATIRVNEGENILEYYVSGDVLSVGADDNYLRISMGGKTAKALLDKMNCMMPTKKMCDQIFQAADVKITPRPMGASSAMSSTQVLINHNMAINSQVVGRPFTLLTGHKKDTCIAKSLLTNRSRIAIYGWFYPNGKAIQGPQPNSTSHSINYQDYSSSIRLVSRSALFNGQQIDLFSLLNDSDKAYMISEEGPYDPSSIYT
jgi:hypothetical protein